MDTHVTNCSTWITKVAGDSMLYAAVVTSFSATVLFTGLLALQSAGIVCGVGSLCLTQSIDQSAACSGFAAVGPTGTGDIDRLLHGRCRSSECGQCHVYS